MQTTTEFSDYLLGFVVRQMETLERDFFQGLVLPSRLAGYPMGADVKGDLLFVLGMLHEAAVSQINDANVMTASRKILESIDGKATHSFYSYRTAETLLRCQTEASADFESNPLLEGFNPAQIAEVAKACDSTQMVAQLGKTLPRNYVAVLGRCELARVALGLTQPNIYMDDLVDRTRDLLSRNSKGFIDDSLNGESRYDIYSADIYLFTEPFSNLLGDVWTSGFNNVLDFISLTGTTDGTALPWGRSTGALGLCINIELAGMVLGRNMNKEPDHWLARGINAAEHLDAWFSNGLINAHRGKSTFAYRGPFRQVQMTLDILGKLLQTVLELKNTDTPELNAASFAFPKTDKLYALSTTSNASAWSFANDQLRFVVPFVGGTASDYLPAPRNPGVFEYPVDSDLATGVPVVTQGEVSFTTAMVPTALSTQKSQVTATWAQLSEVSRKLEGERKLLDVPTTVEYSANHRSIDIKARFALDSHVDAISWQFSEIEKRPLKVRFKTDLQHQLATVPVHGLKPYRSFWHELSRVHQIDIPLTGHNTGTELEVSATITPKLRVAQTIGDHHYQRSLYDPIAEDVVDVFFPRRCWRDLAEAKKFLANIDLFHLHWPEHFLGTNLSAHEAMIRCLKACDVGIVWTQHNLVPHNVAQRKNAHEIYQAWAAAADGVVHHSETGKTQVMSKFNFAESAVHSTIFHGHFGHLQAQSPTESRPELETELGLASDKIRIGIVGAPRIEKNIQGFLNAFAKSKRTDIELYVPALSGTETLPDDSRIKATAYSMVDRELYNKRLATIDLLAFPIESGDLLTTGVVGDAIGWGIPGLVSDWRFLTESLGGAAMPMGNSERSMTDAIDRLTRDQIDHAAEEARNLRPHYDWQNLSKQFLAMLEALGTKRI